MTDALDGLLEGMDPLALLERERRRLDDHFSRIGLEEWARPSRCEGWRVRDVLAHLASGEPYNQACLADEVEAFMQKVAPDGFEGLSLNEMNAREVAKRAEQPIDDVLREWRFATERTLSEMRKLPPGADIATSVGSYPLRRQLVHLAVEAATHADDIGVPVDADERAGRGAWLAQACRFLLAEQGLPVRQVAGGQNEVEVERETVTLPDAELVAAATGRLGDDSALSPEQRRALWSFG